VYGAHTFGSKVERLNEYLSFLELHAIQLLLRGTRAAEFLHLETRRLTDSGELHCGAGLCYAERVEPSGPLGLACSIR